MAPTFTSTSIGQPMTLLAGSIQTLPTEHIPHSQPVAMAMQPVRPQRTVPKADLYLCKTANNASEPTTEEDVGNKSRVSLNDLEHSFKDFGSQQIKDSLSSFLPNVPGEFDRMPDTMLRQLLEQRTIGGKDFAPLSGQALLGFRLLPGPLPEMYRMDPPLAESKPHHKKRKHKHKNIEKGEDGGETSAPPSSKFKLPSDAFTFIKSESTSLPHLAPSHAPPHAHTSHSIRGDSPVGRQNQSTMSILAAATHSTYQITPSNMHVAGAPAQLMGPVSDSRITSFPGKKPKKAKKEKKNKKERGDKKKKRKHHSQDPPGPGSSGSSLLPHQQSPFGQFNP